MPRLCASVWQKEHTLNMNKDLCKSKNYTCACRERMAWIYRMHCTHSPIVLPECTGTHTHTDTRTNPYGIGANYLQFVYAFTLHFRLMPFVLVHLHLSHFRHSQSREASPWRHFAPRSRAKAGHAQAGWRREKYHSKLFSCKKLKKKLCSTCIYTSANTIRHVRICSSIESKALFVRPKRQISSRIGGVRKSESSRCHSTIVHCTIYTLKWIIVY